MVVLVMSSSGLEAWMVNMQLLGLLCPFLFLIRYQQILHKQKICLTSFNYVLNSASLDVFMLIISFTVSPARSLETMTTLVTSCGLIFAGKCLFVYGMFPLLKRAEKVLCEIISKKYDFLMRQRSFESVPEISLPPCSCRRT
jgi:hypothetical protein